MAAQQKQLLGQRTTLLMASVLGKRQEVTSVLVEEVIGPLGDGWFIGGQGIDLQRNAPVHCDIYITAGSNTEVDKARMIAAMRGLLHEALDDPPTASYIIIHEVPATDWGYDGQTQAARRLTAQKL